MSEELDRYLWDKSGISDPEIAELEALLSELRYTKEDPSFLGVDLKPRPLPRWRRVVDWLQLGRPFLSPRYSAAVAVLVVLLAIVIGVVRQHFTWVPNQPWTIVRVEGSPRFENAVQERNDKFAVGQALVTDAVSRAHIRIANIGMMDVEPNSRVRLIETATGRHRIALDYGTIRGRTWAPPFSFAIETSSSTLFDVGCAFTFHVDQNGFGLVHVDSGWVQFEYRDEKTIVPAGAEAKTRPQLGPGTPYFPDASPEFQAAVTAFDTSSAGSASRAAAIEAIATHARDRDAITLLSLFSKADQPHRELLLNTLERFAPIPEGTTREQVLSLNQVAMDRYWRALGLGNPKSWLMHWRDLIGN